MDIIDVKLNNIKEILSCIRSCDEITIKEIAQQTSLSISTVNTVCKELERRKIIEVKKVGTGQVGRIPSVLRMRFNRFLTFCLDYQRRNVLRLAILNCRNDILLTEQYDTSNLHGFREIVTFAHSIFKDKRKLFGDSAFLGIGVVVSGIFDKRTQTILNSAILSLEGAPVKSIVEDVFKIPCYVDNEANLCAVSFHHRFPEMQDFLYMHISQGFGIGVIANGALLRGYNGYAAEITHLPFGNPKRRCLTCKNMGCIEPEVSIPGLLDSSAWRGIPGNDTEQWKQLATEIRGGNPAYKSFLLEKGELIGKVLSVLIDLFDPQRIFIGGEITDIYEQIRPSIESPIRQHCFMVRDTILPLNCDYDSATNMMLGVNQIMFEKWEPLSNELY